MNPLGYGRAIRPSGYAPPFPHDGWEITLYEGKNPQVPRMAARKGFPTLRLIRFAVGPWKLDGLKSGDWREDFVSQ